MGEFRVSVELNSFMLLFLPAAVRGFIALLLLTIITVGTGILTFLVALFRLLPIKAFQKKIDYVLHNIPDYWTSMVKGIIKLCTKTRWHIFGMKNLKKDGRYLMIANHRSWVDILVLQKVFSRKIPALRFFMKKQLLWQLPIAGFACKLLGYPVMERYSREFLQQHPELKGKDIEATRKVCEHFKNQPVTLINFLEGGRFTQEKYERQKPPFKYLLKPKAGGVAFVLAAMGNQLEQIIDVTIIYPNMQISFWDFLCGRIKDIYVYIHTIPVKPVLLGNYHADDNYREFFHYWLNEQWLEKDKFITNKLRGGSN